MIKLQHCLISILILLLDIYVAQITAGSHEAVLLIGVPLDLVWDLEVLLIGTDVVFGLILGRKHEDRDADVGRIVRVNHGGVSSGGGFEGSARG